ncbi:MAG: hypothetical protein P8P30_09635 [Rickettsiales bacterium]|nr:hypothetical protein [Rickettsiales bacterium]
MHPALQGLLVIALIGLVFYFRFRSLFVVGNTDSQSSSEEEVDPHDPAYGVEATEIE